MIVGSGRGVRINGYDGLGHNMYDTHNVHDAHHPSGQAGATSHHPNSDHPNSGNPNSDHQEVVVQTASSARTSGHEQLELETLLLSRHLAPLRQSVPDLRLERSGYTLLSRIAAEGAPMSLAELSHALNLDVSTLNRQTAAITKAGLLHRVADPDGGLARKFEITAQGREQLDRARSANTTGLARVVDRWSDADLATFVGYLRRFNADIERLDGRPWPRD